MLQYVIRQGCKTGFLICFLQISFFLKAQKPLATDLVTLLQAIPVLPASLDMLHQQFTVKTKNEEKFDDAAISEPHKQILTWIKEIHDETIRKRISAHRRADMTYEVQYDDERLKLALRPMTAAMLAKKTATASSTTRNLVKQLIQLEQSFDWQEYFKHYNAWFKEVNGKLAAWDSKNRALQDKIPVIQTAFGSQKDEKKEAELFRQMIREKQRIQNELFENHSSVWKTYFQKYSRQNLALQELLEKINYGRDLPDNEKKILLPALADVQARGLEALEKMIWQEMILATLGETWYGEKTAAEFYLR